MNDNTLWVCFTMDVERIKEHSPTGGPPDWDFAEKSVRSYCDILLEKGYPATLFIVPDTAEKQRNVFLDLGKDGHELGMHFHDQSWKDHWKNPGKYDYLGGYTAQKQKEILGEAREQMAQALGFAPLAFRPGNVSANDHTFPVAREVGFTHGSVSQPGRCAPRVKAVWKGACRYVHRAHHAFRLVPGDLDFIEAPITSDHDRTDHWTGVGDIRFESATADQVAEAVQKEISHQVSEKAPLRHVCFFTHNFVRYWNGSRDDKSGLDRVNETIKRLPEMAEGFGLSIQGATIGAVREVFMKEVLR